jgi:hypothetical protein
VPEETIERFVGLLVCDNHACGEVVAVSGDTDVVGYFVDGPEGSEYEHSTLLRPKSMFPPPPLFSIPKSVPHLAVVQIKLAFQLFWTDLPSAASRLRTSLELVLDALKVPREVPSQKDTMTRLELFDRILNFANSATDPDSAESMHALRILGNLGTHGEPVPRELFFDALDIYEEALLEIFERKSDKLKAKRDRLLALGRKPVK